MSRLFKYPRTHHIEGSKLQAGDEDTQSIPLKSIESRFVVIEEKLDGANSGISFDADGRLLLQSRGHFLDGGPREKHFALFKTWANVHRQALGNILADRYVMYGEWLYAKHTIFYDALPHYFMEFDIFDRTTSTFLSTEERRALLDGTTLISVPVLYSGLARMAKLPEMIGRSLYKTTGWKDRLSAIAKDKCLDAERAGQETDPSDLMEGLYIKVEEGGKVAGRYKYVRASFLSAVLDSGSHWLERPIVPNQLAGGVDIFSSDPGPGEKT